MNNIRGKLSVVVGGQYGSEAKGAVAGYLCRPEKNLDGVDVAAVRVAGPNAGHTVYGDCPAVDCPVDGQEHLPVGEFPHPWKLRQVPVAAVTNPNAQLYIAAGSEIDPQVLLSEIRQLDSAGYRASARMVVDGSATVLEPHHSQNEQQMQLSQRIGSTAKGIGEARVARLRRVARTWGDYLSQVDYVSPKLANLAVADTAHQLNSLLASRYHVVIEGTQGYALGLHTSHYPQVTSSDTRAIDFLAMAGISPWLVSPENLDIWVTLRTYPIRVAGNSGEMRDETDWESLGLTPERTTVTNKVRRVGRWDPDLARKALLANGATPGATGPVRVALTMADYLVPSAYGIDNSVLDDVDDGTLCQLRKLLDRIHADLGHRPRLVGTSPTTMIDLMDSEGKL